MPFEYVIKSEPGKRKILAKICIHKNVITMYYSDWAKELEVLREVYRLGNIYKYITHKDEEHNQLHLNTEEQEVFHHHHKLLAAAIIEPQHLENHIWGYEKGSEQIIEAFKKVGLGDVCWIGQEDLNDLLKSYESYLVNEIFSANKTISNNTDRLSTLNSIYLKVNQLTKQGVALINKDNHKSLKIFENVLELLTNINPQSQQEFQDLKIRLATANFNLGKAYAKTASKAEDYYNACQYLNESFRLRKELFGETDDRTKKAEAACNDVYALFSAATETLDSGHSPVPKLF